MLSIGREGAPAVDCGRDLHQYSFLLIQTQLGWPGWLIKYQGGAHLLCYMHCMTKTVDINEELT